MATQPERHASTKDPSTWSDYATALAAVQAGHADGITYMLTEDDPFAAIDLDHCRDVNTRSIDVWAQNFLDVGRHTYSEVTPSGAGCRIWGLASGDSLHQQIHAGDRRQGDCGRAVPAHQQGADDHRLQARHDPRAHQHRSGARLGRGLGRAPQGCSCGSSCAGQPATASTAAATAAATASIRSSRSSAPERRPEPTAATCFTRSSATISAAAGMPSRSWSTCSNSPTASAAAISAKAGCAARSPGAPANINAGAVAAVERRLGGQGAATAEGTAEPDRRAVDDRSGAGG